MAGFVAIQFHHESPDGLSWGAHLCQFYHNASDWLDLSTRYFLSGLSQNQYCLWILPAVIKRRDFDQMIEAKPPFKEAVLSGQMEIVTAVKWYSLKTGFDPKKVIHCMDEHYKEALKKGYEGIRVAGGPHHIREKSVWKRFTDYEKKVQSEIKSRKIIALCTHSFVECPLSAMNSLIQSHDKTLIRRGGDWEVL